MPKALIVIGRIAWVLPVIMGLGFLNWVGFLYPAIRMRKQHPIWLRVLYLSIALNVIAIIIVAMVPDGSPWIGVYFLVWLASIIGFFIMLKWWIPFDPNQNTTAGDAMVTGPHRTAQQHSVIEESSGTPQAGQLDDGLKVAKSPLNLNAHSDSLQSAKEGLQATPDRSQARDARASTHENRNAKVFISHATEDRELTLRLADELESQEIETWLAFRDVQVGDNYAEEIVKALASADYMLVVLSEDAIQSPHVRREVTIAIDRGVPLLPVNMSPSEDFMWSLPVDWTYWLSLAQVLRHTDEVGTAQELARRIGRG